MESFYEPVWLLPIQGLLDGTGGFRVLARLQLELAATIFFLELNTHQ